MNKKYFLLPLLLLCGCGLFVAPQVREFDLQIKQNPAQGAIRVAAVRNLSNSGQRFLLRSQNGVTRDPLNIWTAEPGTLICNALNSSFRAERTVPTQVFICDVNCFEADTDQLIFRLSGSFRRQGTQETSPFDITVPLENKCAQSIINAASAAVEKLAVLLSGSKK